MLTPSVTRTSQHQQSSRNKRTRTRENTNSEFLDVEMGLLHHWFFGTNGRMGAECQSLLEIFAEKLSRKDGEPYAIVITWLRIHLPFEKPRQNALRMSGQLSFRLFFNFIFGHAMKALASNQISVARNSKVKKEF